MCESHTYILYIYILYICIIIVNENTQSLTSNVHLPATDTEVWKLRELSGGKNLSRLGSCWRSNFILRQFLWSLGILHFQTTVNFILTSEVQSLHRKEKQDV